MSSGQDHNHSRRRSRDSHRRPSPLQDPNFPPLPPLSFPSLRYWSSYRDRDGSESTTAARPPSRHWSTAARRAERIRNLDHSRGSSQHASPSELQLNPSDHLLSETSRLSERAGAFNQSSQYDPSSRSTELRDLDRTLHEANSHLRALLDHTSSSSLAAPLMSGSVTSPFRSHDFPEDNRRHGKRRKLDAEKYSTGFRAFRYGKYGQVEPGQLQMEIVSCDGGMFCNESQYVAENLLKDDTSVYCTKGNRCNIILRHQGSTIFTLQELVIKAPGSMNYSHPVREGMVFVTMDQDQTLNRTAQYQVQYVPKCGRSEARPAARSVPQWQALQRETQHVISIRHHDDGTTSTRERRPVIYRTDFDEERGSPEMPDEFTNNQPDFNVTTECTDDEDEEEEDGPHPGVRTYRSTPNRIGSLPFEHGDSDAEDDFLFATDDGMPHEGLQSRSHSSRSAAADLSLSQAWEAHANAAQEAVRAVGGQLLVPHARFFIEKKKSKCTIRFDPPVSGKLILLKMWSSRHDPDSNIDIQSVIARGFAGPRYFPSVQLS